MIKFLKKNRRDLFRTNIVEHWIEIINQSNNKPAGSRERRPDS